MEEAHSSPDRLINKPFYQKHRNQPEVADKRVLSRRRLFSSKTATSLTSLNSQGVFKVLSARRRCHRCYHCTLHTIGCNFDIQKGGVPWIPSSSRDIMRSFARQSCETASGYTPKTLGSFTSGWKTNSKPHTDKGGDMLWQRAPIIEAPSRAVSWQSNSQSHTRPRL